MTAEMKHMITVRMNKVEREQLRQAAELAKVSMNWSLALAQNNFPLCQRHEGFLPFQCKLKHCEQSQRPPFIICERTLPQ